VIEGEGREGSRKNLKVPKGAQAKGGKGSWQRKKRGNFSRTENCREKWLGVRPGGGESRGIGSKGLGRLLRMLFLNTSRQATANFLVWHKKSSKTKKREDKRDI